MNSLEWMIQRTSAWWAVGFVILTAMLTPWGAPPDALAQATLQNLSYGYDNKGNVTAITDTINGNQTFGYDELDRLTSATGPYGTHTYSYDQIGNVTFNPLVGNYAYPTSGTGSVRPHAVSTAGSNTYGYDNNGNLLSGAGRTLTWDFENRPTSITSGGVTTTMVYDGDGGRVKKIAGDVTVRYIGKLYECENATCVKYIFAGSQRIAVKQVTNGLVDHYHPDHLGSSSVITAGADGAQEQALTYYPFGATRTNTSGTTPPTDVPYKYTGKELDDTTGLYFYEARYYDATLGRFISADTIVPNPRDPQSFNRYTYVLNNPLLYTDPTGHFSFNIGKFFSRLLDNPVVRVVAWVVAPATVAFLDPATRVQTISAVAGATVTVFAGPIAGGAVAGAVSGTLNQVEGRSSNILRSTLAGAAGGAVGWGVGTAAGPGFGSGILAGFTGGAAAGAVAGGGDLRTIAIGAATGATAGLLHDAIAYNAQAQQTIYLKAELKAAASDVLLEAKSYEFKYEVSSKAYQDINTAVYGHTPPRTDFSSESVGFDPTPSGTELRGLVHSHTSTSNFSPKDLALMVPGVEEILVTPNGEFKIFDWKLREGIPFE